MTPKCIIDKCPTCGTEHRSRGKSGSAFTRSVWAERIRQARAPIQDFVVAVSPNGREVRLFTRRAHAASYCRARGWLVEPCVHVSVKVNATGKPRGGRKSA